MIRKNVDNGLQVEGALKERPLTKFLHDVIFLLTQVLEWLLKLYTTATSKVC